MCENFKIAQRM